MKLASLTAISPLDGRYEKQLSDCRTLFSEYGLMKYRVEAEIKWFIALADLAKLPQLFLSLKDAERIKKIERKTNHDVKAIEYFLKEAFTQNKSLQGQSEFIHFACTSEDINNIAYALILKDTLRLCLVPTIEKLIRVLTQLSHQYANTAMLARTHGQAATPTSVGKEFANVVARLQRGLTQLQSVTLSAKMNGATGNYNAHLIAFPNINWQKITATFIHSLGLTENKYTTQIEPHDYIAEFVTAIAQINTVCLDFSKDMWGYISLNYFKQKHVKDEVGSSTMPHKINPIDFENAEGNLGLANALCRYFAEKLPVSRWQRDLSDSTVLRNVGVAISHSLLAYQSLLKGLTKTEVNEATIFADLDQHWEVLAEPIQTVMRAHGIPSPYEKLKAFTRGKQIDKVLLHAFIQELKLPKKVTAQLLTLTPHTYIGLAPKLAKDI
jgi:adenylosuccinate lyase